MPADTVAIGECMVELAGDIGGPARLGFGGDTLNTAVYLARLGVGVEYLTALGRDAFSDQLRAAWAGEGVGTALVLTDPARLPGIYAIRNRADGERHFDYWRQASAARQLFALPGIDAALAAAARARLLYLSGITLSLFDAAAQARLGRVAAAVRAGGGTVAFDPNYRAAGWASAAAARAAIAAFARHVTVALPTLTDEALLHGDADAAATLVRWRQAGAEDVVVKLGAAGCLTADGPVTARAVAAIDTTGAGDAFNAAYLAARRQGSSAHEAGDRANRLAAVVVGHAGAIIPRDAMPGA